MEGVHYWFASESWELRTEGPNGFERSYGLASSSGEHQPEVIGKLILKLLPPPGHRPQASCRVDRKRRNYLHLKNLPQSRAQRTQTIY
jgi:hypothetical protein